MSTVVDPESDLQRTDQEIERWEEIAPKVQVLARKLRQQYVEANPQSKLASERATKALPGGNTRAVLFYEPFPMVLTSGRDCFVKSLDGNEYLDMVSEYSAAMFGHSHPEIMSALRNALDHGINLGGHNLMEVELAEHIVSRFPSIDMVRFCNSGTEANINALGMALHITQRKKILAFGNGYHGGNLSFPEHPNPLNLPHDFVLGVYNDIGKTRKLITSDIAAIILEPMQGRSGMIPATTQFLKFLRQQATEIGAILIFDEVITSRLHINGLQGFHGISPDMTTLGKYLGGGPPFGAFGGRRDIMEKLDPRTSVAGGGVSQSGTYNNNILTMSAGVAASKILTKERIEKVNDLGDTLKNGINQILHTTDSDRGLSLIHSTGFGSVIGLHFLGPLADDIKEAFFFHMLSRDIYVGQRGFISLNIMHEQEHVDRVLEAVREFSQGLLRDELSRAEHMSTGMESS